MSSSPENGKKGLVGRHAFLRVAGTLGSRTLDTVRYVRALKTAGYDGTITLEVFSPDWHYLAYSRDLLRQLWEQS